MKTEKQGFIFLYEWIPKLKAIGGNPDSKITAILETLATIDQTGKAPALTVDLNELEKLTVDDMKSVVAGNREKYIERCEVNRQNALKGGRKPKETERNRTVANATERKAKETELNPKKPDKDIDKDKDKDKDLYISPSFKTKFHNFNERDNTAIIDKLERGNY